MKRIYTNFIMLLLAVFMSTLTAAASGTVYVNMGSNTVSGRTYASLARALAAQQVNSMSVVCLDVTGAITGEDIKLMREMGTSGALEELRLRDAVIRVTGNSTMDTYSTNRVVTEDNVIPSQAFFYAAKLKKIILPEETVNIGTQAFLGTKIERLLIGPNMQVPNIDAFRCETLQILDVDARFGASFNDDDKIDFFMNCPFKAQNLKSIRVGEEIDYQYWGVNTITVFNYPFIKSVNGVLYSKDMKTLYYYPPKHSGYSFTIPASVEQLGFHCFDGLENISTLVIPPTVKSIGYGAFWRAEGLHRVIISAGCGMDNQLFWANTYKTEGYHYLEVFLCDPEPTSVDIFGYTSSDPAFDYTEVINNNVITIYAPYLSLEAYRAKSNLNPFNIQPMLVGTGESTPFYYNKDVFLYIGDWSKTYGEGEEDAPSPNAYFVAGVDETTGEAKMYNLNSGNGSEIPANTPVVVKPTREGGIYVFGVYERGRGTVNVWGNNYHNYLIGVATPTTVQPTEGNRYNYKLSGDKFVRITSPVQMPAGSVYLQTTVKKNNLSQSVLSRDEYSEYAIPTDIDEAVTEDNVEGLPIYNLNGQRVSSPQRGVYVVKGRKVMFK